MRGRAIATVLLVSILGLVTNFFKIEEPFQTIIQSMLWIAMIICGIAGLSDTQSRVNKKTCELLQALRHSLEAYSRTYRNIGSQQEISLLIHNFNNMAAHARVMASQIDTHLKEQTYGDPSVPVKST